MDIKALLNQMDGIEQFELLKFAKFLSETERYKDMYECMKKIIELKSKQEYDLSDEERTLFFDACKYRINNPLNAYKQMIGDDLISHEKLSKYKNILSTEIKEICIEILNILMNKLLKIRLCIENDIDFLCSGFIRNINMKYFEKNNVNIIINICVNYFDFSLDDDCFEFDCENGNIPYYFGKCGEYYGYLSELYKGKYTIYTKMYYEKGYGLAQKKLKATDPIRLKLSENYSVFLHDTLNKRDEAINVTKDAFDVAIEKLDELDDFNYKNSTLIMQSMRDKLRMWSTQDIGDSD